jgi:pimeloyl-ACP methyl ester carboxylesterase
MGTVTSQDGTTIAFDRAGSGPALVMIDPALGYRDVDSIRGLGAVLARELTVLTYDRRGRGLSTDTAPYAVEREVEDLAALIDEAGGRASVFGFSSGGLLALRAAAAGLPIERMVLVEPPIGADDDPADVAFTAEIAALVAAGRNHDAVQHMLVSIGMPPEAIDGIADRPAMDAVAPTLVHDCTISASTGTGLLASVPTPTLVVDSSGSTDDLTGSAAAVAAALPRGRHRSLPGGWHGVPDDVLAPVVLEFLTVALTRPRHGERR